VSFLQRFGRTGRQPPPVARTVPADHLPAPAPSLLAEEQIRDRPALEQLVQAIHDWGGTYHQLNLRPDLRVLGDYDMTRYVDAYEIPDDLTGLKVLDVGTAAGYFALECARRGGDVVAIDVWDSPPIAEIVKSADLRIRYEKKNVYDLDEAFGQFDVVVCGSLLLHLPDLVGAVRALRRVCRGRLHISSACPADIGPAERPLCEFLGAKGEDGDYYTYWLVGEEALRRLLLLAGFARVDRGRHFNLTSGEGRHPFATPHIALTAFVA
jgi:tRNA (mo5U34)-methyltransferase